MPGQALPYQDHARPGLDSSGSALQELCWTRTSVKHNFAMYYQACLDVGTATGDRTRYDASYGLLARRPSHGHMCHSDTVHSVYSTVPLAGISCSAHSTSNVMDSAPISERKVHQLYHLKEPLQSDSLSEATWTASSKRASQTFTNLDRT